MSRGSSDEKNDQGLIERTATSLVGRLVDLGIDGKGPLDPAQKLADDARAKHGDTESAVDAVMSSARRSAAAGGFVTGLGGFVTLPVALPANVVGFYVIATRAVAATAALRGFDLTRPEVRTAVLLVLTGSDASSVLGKVGLGGGGGIVTRLAAGRLSGTSLMVVQKAIGFRLIAQLGTGVLGKLGRGIPLAGGLIGAGSDVWLLRRILKTAKKEFTGDQLSALGGGR
jgi:hypothetical protein